MIMKLDLKRCGMGLGILLLAGWTASGCSRAVPAGKEESAEARLQRLEDREEIRQLLMDYGQFLDKRDFASFSQLFAEKEGEWIGGMGKAKTPQGIRKLMEDSMGRGASGKPVSPNYHVFMNEIIRVNGQEATANTKWMFVVQNSSKQPQPFYLGHYEDTLVKENGRWKFLRRVAHSDIPPDDPESPK